MKHPSSRQLYDYWNERRGRRAAPERGEIEPAAIRGLLGDSFVLSGDASVYRFRIAGTRICTLFGRELRGEPFGSIWDEDGAAVMRDAVAAAVQEATGFVAGAQVEGVPPAGFELLVLPLVHRGIIGARMLGVLTAMVRPAWMGLRPAAPLQLGPIRYLAHASPSAVLTGGGAADPARLRRNFTVIDGGLM